MRDSVLVYVGVAVVVLVVFALVWWIDARRAKRQANDPERLEVDNEQRPHRRRRR